jgi:DNA sulfur modification protein DndB
MIGEIKNVIKRTAGRHTYYFGTITSDKAKIATFVPVIESSDTYLDQDTTDGYQRPGTKSRMNKFKRYLQANPDRLIPPVILSARGSWEFSGDGPVGTLTLNGKAAIIDGQHRMGGLVAQYEEDEEPKSIDFICFADLSIDDEIFEFRTINGEQKGVPKALNTFLQGEEEAVLAWELNLNDESPLKGKIYRTRSDQFTYYALHSIAKNIKRTFDHGAFKDLDFDDKLEALIRLWKSIAKHNAEAWSDMKLAKREQKMKLAELTGNIAWSLVAPQILMKGWTPATQEFNFETIDKVIEYMSEDVDWNKDGEYQGMTGEYGGRRISQQLESILAYYS